MINKKVLTTVILPLLLAIVIIFSIVIFNIFGNTTVNAQNLLEGISSNKVSAEELSDEFIEATSSFSIDLLKQSISSGKNSLISPTSVALALGMTANGADGKTLEQMNSLLGDEKVNLEQLNKYYYSMSSKLESYKENKVQLANSIWYKDHPSLKVNPDFLQKNADYYKSAAYKADFNSEDTVKDINKWVKNNTNGMIDKIIDNINPNTIMYLFNTVLFEAEWNKVYDKTQIHEGKFILADGNSVSTDFMYSSEKYLKDENTQGFIKPYKGNKYSFVALLPNEGISVEEYIDKLNGESFSALINNPTNETASAGIPKFKYKYEVNLVEPLKALGLTEAFDDSAANFTKMATSSDGNIYIGDVVHKTFIQVDELGTKAGAVTKVEMRTEGAALVENKVILDRPFIYAILDNETNLPLFIGTLMNPIAE